MNYRYLFSSLLTLTVLVSAVAGETATTNEIDHVPYISTTPSGTENDRLGIILVFHGKGGKAEPMVNSVNKSLSNYGMGNDYVVVGVQNDRKPLWEEWGDTAIEVVSKITEKVLADNARIDPRRIYTYGFSAGAWMAGSFAAKRPKLIAAAMPFGMGIGDRYIIQDKANPIPPMYMAIGSEDPHREYANPSAATLKRNAVIYLYRYMPGIGHAPNYKEVNDDSYRWLVAQRNELVMPTKAEIELLKTFTKAKEQPVTAERIQQVANIGGSLAGSALVPIITGKNAALAIAAMQAASKTWCGLDACKAMIRRVKDTDAEVRAAAISALGVWANWRISLAQEAIIAAAKSGAPAERVVAFTTLQFAVALQIDPKANMQDPALVHVAVAALSDKDVAVRTAAYAVIKRADIADFNPAETPAQQAKAIAAWRAWAESASPRETPATK